MFIAIQMLCGIILFDGYGLYRCITYIDKPVIAVMNSFDYPFEMNSQKYFVRQNGIYNNHDKLTQ